MKTNYLYIKRNWERKNGGLKSGNKLKIIETLRKCVERLGNNHQRGMVTMPWSGVQICKFDGWPN